MRRGRGGGDEGEDEGSMAYGSGEAGWLRQIGLFQGRVWSGGKTWAGIEIRTFLKLAAPIRKLGAERQD